MQTCLCKMQRFLKQKLTIFIWIFYVFLNYKHRLWRSQRVQTVNVLSKNKKIIYPCKAQFYYIKWGFRGINYMGVLS